MDALRSHAAHHDYAGLSIDVEAPPRLRSLPAAVEVAAYRIALEALTNAARHADARHAHLRLSTDGASLVVEVSDDGHGLNGVGTSGVGLASMRERAAELGGSCTIGEHPGGGVHVHAILPWTSEGGAA